MRLSYGEDGYDYRIDSHRRRGWGSRLAILPVMALFANLAMPTQAALPEIGASDGMAPEFRVASVVPSIEVASGPVDLFPEGDINRRFGSDSGKIWRWWAAAARGADASGADQAILRGFPVASHERFAGSPSVRDSVVSDGSVAALKVAYAPYDARKVVWSPSTFLSAPPTPIPAPARKGRYSWSQRSLPKDVFSKEQQACLATAIYFEARGESRKGQAAVAQVILNRVRNPAYPDTPCGVVYQNARQYKKCQFSFACDGIEDRIGSGSAYSKAREIASAVTSGEMYVPEVGSATHYFADYVRPRWANSMVKMASIGEHHFYRTHGGGWK